MADQHHESAPALTNQIGEDIPDIAEAIRFHWDVLGNFCGTLSTSTASGIYPGAWGRLAKTADYTATDADYYIEYALASATKTLTLPSAATAGAGRYYIVKITDATYPLAIATNGSETIDGADAYALNIDNEVMIVISDGTNWQILHHNINLLRPPQRAVFTHSDDDTITIGAGVYHLQGEYEWVYWESAITFDFGTGGSNASSSDIDAGANDVHYIYIDDSAVDTNNSPLLVAACFLNSKTAPTWNAAKQGYYNGSDRCIFACTTDSSDDLYPFYHDGGTFVGFDEQITERSGADPGTDFSTNEVLFVPSFCRKAKLTFVCQYATAGGFVQWRQGSSSATTGHYVLYTHADAIYAQNTCDVNLDSSLSIDIKVSAGDGVVSIYGDGWYLPSGM